MSDTNSEKSRDSVLELAVVILLGVTALLTAWASWISSLHGGNQSADFTQSNNIAAEGNSEYNAGVQSLMQDMIIYNDINNLLIDLHFAEALGDEDEAEKVQWKIDEIFTGSVSEELADAFNWAMEEAVARNESVSPFEKEGFTEMYFETANELLAQSEEILEQGKKSGTYGDAYGLVTVIYSVVLFLLGITGTFRNAKNKMAVVIISSCAFVVATIYMFTIPMPLGFNLLSFFGGK